MLQVIEGRKSVTVGAAEFTIGDLVSHTRFNPSRPFDKTDHRFAILTQIYTDNTIYTDDPRVPGEDDDDNIYFGVLYTDNSGLLAGTVVRHHSSFVKEESLPRAVHHLGRANETLS